MGKSTISMGHFPLLFVGSPEGTWHVFGGEHATVGGVTFAETAVPV